MRLTTRSEYGLICLKYLSEHQDRAPISLGEITDSEKLPKDYVEQIFVRLRRAGIIQSQKGVHGGFSLARPASEISVKEIFETLEGNHIFEVFCSPEIREKIVCEHYSGCSVRPIWQKLAELIDQFCAGITLEMLLEDEDVVMSNLNGIVDQFSKSVESREVQSQKSEKKIIYMDNHATTPVDPRVLEVMEPCYKDVFGNAASKTHPLGWQAEKLVSKAREQVASLIGADKREIVFTSGATESINLSLKGAFEMYAEKGNHIITQATEHKAVLDSCAYLEKRGAKITYLPVDAFGQISIEDLKNAITDKTILISVMFANNEIGTIQPIEAIGKIAKEKDILFHVDAAQAAGKIEIYVQKLGIDLLSISAHKFYGPKGIGALYVRRKEPRVRLTPISHGGGHELGFRSGTLNVAGIVGMGKACEIAQVEMKSENEKLLKLRERLKEKIEAGLDGVSVNGHPTERLAGNLNLSFSYIEGESLLMGINDDIAVSAGSACSSGGVGADYVLKALGKSPELMNASIRFGLGRFNTNEEVDYVAEKIIQVVTKLREMSPLYKAAKENI